MRAGGLVARVEAGGVAPEQFQIVVIAAVGIEEVDDDVDVIDEDPGGLVIAGHAVAVMAEGGGALVDGVGDGADLPVGGAGGDDEVVADGAEAAQVEDDDVVASHLRDQAGEFEGELSGSGAAGGSTGGVGAGGGGACWHSGPGALAAQERLTG